MEQIPIGGPAPDNVVHLRPRLRSPIPRSTRSTQAPPDAAADQVDEAVETPVEPAPAETQGLTEIPVAVPETEKPAATTSGTTEAAGPRRRGALLEEVMARDAAAAADDEAVEGPAPNTELTLMLEQIARVGLGLTVGVVDAVAGSLRRTADEQPRPTPRGTSPLRC